MSSRRRVAQAAVVGACAALLVVGWYTLAPRQIGGRASYVTTTGSSMEPLLHQGDLAVVYRDAQYHVGDVVAYHNPEIHHVVLHRIVGVEDDGFAVQGDNNTWLDDYHPAGREILGAMAFHVPGLGTRLGAVRSPWGMTAVASLAALALFGGRRRMGRGSRAPSAEHENAPAVRSRNGHAPQAPHRPMSLPASLVPVLAGVSILALAMSAILFSLSASVSNQRDVTYNQDGAFSYTGAVSLQGRPIYGRDALQTGDPAYLELVRSLQVSFDYALSSPSAIQASGSVGMIAELSDTNGWTRTFELSPSASFEGPTAHVQGTLDLRVLHAMIRQLEKVTGVERDHYTVAVRPDVQIAGTLGGHPLKQTFGPQLRFMLDPLQLQLEPAGSAPVGQEVADPIHPASGGLLKVTAQEPRSFSVLGLDLRLAPLRAAALALFVISAAAWLGVVIRRRILARHGEAEGIEARYGQFLVPVHAGVGSATERTVQVDTFDALIRLANHYGHVVLHEEGAGFHAYSVEEDGITYRYLVPNGVHP